MSTNKHICFFTGKRGGFSHMVPIIELIKKEAKLSYSIIASDMHLSPFFGNTIKEVTKWTENVYSVETALHSDSKMSRAKSIGIGIMGISELLAQIKPDIVFVLGDRGEVLAMVICALEMNIPVVHLAGGDICQGGVDEPVRHAITKLANIHFASNQDSANRILKMGEEPWRVYNVGLPVMDLIRQKRFSHPDKVKQMFDLDTEKPILLLLQHSVTWQVEDAEYQMRQTMEAIDQLGYQTIAVYPCSDPGYESIIKVMLEYSERLYFQLHKNIEFSDFWGLMNIASVFIGNSSSGVLETPSFKIPFVNIGIRQEGRLRADNVIDVDHSKEQIMEAIRTAIFDNEFKEKVKHCKSPYGDGHASERIVSILKDLKIDESLIRKKMTY
ncbi:MAG: UDP-N-acetylglucosamine 2-epimerase [Thermodesulfobacteriota bacterium]